MRIANIIQLSVVDGPDIRLPIFFQGCQHNCKGCHNPDTHKVDGGYEIDVKSLANIVLMYLDNNPLIKGVTYTGGEPLLQAYNLETLTDLIKEAKPEINFMLYTGFMLKDAYAIYYSLVSKMDYVVDGRYVEELRDISLKFRGSSNQRIYQNVFGTFVDITNA